MNITRIQNTQPARQNNIKRSNIQYNNSTPLMRESHTDRCTFSSLFGFFKKSNGQVELTVKLLEKSLNKKRGHYVYDRYRSITLDETKAYHLKVDVLNNFLAKHCKDLDELTFQPKNHKDARHLLIHFGDGTVDPYTDIIFSHCVIRAPHTNFDGRVELRGRVSDLCCGGSIGQLYKENAAGKLEHVYTGK